MLAVLMQFCPEMTVVHLSVKYIDIFRVVFMISFYFIYE